MQGYVYQSEYARRYYNQGLEQGLEAGREQGLEAGREQGLEAGRERGLHDAVLALARAKLGVVTAQSEAAIRALRDHDQLIALTTALGLAGSEAEARAALESVRAP